MQSKAPTVDAYLAGFAGDELATLTRLRDLIRRHLRGATESMEYGMPTYRTGKDMLCAFNRQKQYFALYVDPGVLAKHRRSLKGLDCGKSCIRFRTAEKLPWEAAEEILRACAAAAGGRS
jgi:uncharacterized protein YdhG (YjbR/CyaY superfamily)